MVSGQLCAAPQGQGCAGSPAAGLRPRRGAVQSGLGPGTFRRCSSAGCAESKGVGASLVDMSGSGGRRVTESMAPGLWVPPCEGLASRRDSGARSPVPGSAVSGTEPRLARGTWGSARASAPVQFPPGSRLGLNQGSHSKFLFSFGILATVPVLSSAEKESRNPASRLF